MHVTEHPRMRVLPAKGNDRLAKNLQQVVEVASVGRKRVIEPIANLAGREVTVYFSTSDLAEVVDH